MQVASFVENAVAKILSLVKENAIANGSAHKRWREIMQILCKFGNPAAICAHVYEFKFADGWYRKWAESYNK